TTWLIHKIMRLSRRLLLVDMTEKLLVLSKIPLLEIAKTGVKRAIKTEIQI
ncbi:MAG: hypothetical protein RLZZ171_751, partial [Cyanobacteriota bacterium]